MKNEIYWQAVKNNDARFNGAFVYGVNSTKIYCKPSCASRGSSVGNKSGELSNLPNDL